MQPRRHPPQARVQPRRGPLDRPDAPGPDAPSAREPALHGPPRPPRPVRRRARAVLARLEPELLSRCAIAGLPRGLGRSPGSDNGRSVNQPVADSPSVSGAFRRIGSLCRRGFAPESPRTAPVFASTRPPRRPLRSPVRRFRVAGTTAPDPIAFVQHAATCAGIPARCRYRGHALPRMAPFGPGLYHVVAAVRDSEHGPSVGGWSTPREGRPVGPGVRRLPRDQALEAPAAAVGVHRSRARSAVRLAGE